MVDVLIAIVLYTTVITYRGLNMAKAINTDFYLALCAGSSRALCGRYYCQLSHGDINEATVFISCRIWAPTPWIVFVWHVSWHLVVLSMVKDTVVEPSKDISICCVPFIIGYIPLQVPWNYTTYLVDSGVSAAKTLVMLSIIAKNKIYMVIGYWPLQDFYKRCGDISYWTLLPKIVIHLHKRTKQIPWKR